MGEEEEDFSKWTSDERQAEIKRLNDQIARYRILMFMVSMNSGWFFYTYNFQFYYCRSVLDMKAPAFSAFQSNTNLPWLIKPLWGFFSDSFRIAGYRFKSHIMILTLVSALSSAYMAINTRPTIFNFTMSNLILSWSVAYVDTMAEGMSAVVTKYYERIKILEELENGKQEGDNESNTAFGNYNAFRNFFRSIMGFVGGFLAPIFGKSTFWSGIILSVFPLVMFLYTLLIFKEDRMSGIFSGCQKFCYGLSVTAKAAFMPSNLLPLLFICLPFIPPNPAIYGNYIILGEGGWTFEEYNLNQFFIVVLMSIALMTLVNFFKNLSFNTLQIGSQITTTISILTTSSLIYSRYFSVFEYSLVWFFINFIGLAAQNMQLTSIVGRISKYLPEGFESTGVTAIISAVNGATIVNGYVNDWVFVPIFDVKPGYYDSRLKAPFILAGSISVFWVLTAPIFLMYG